MSSKVRNRAVIPIPRMKSILEENPLGLSSTTNEGIELEVKFYEHRLDRPMDLMTFFEMNPTHRTTYLMTLHEQFGFQLQDYMDFFHVDKVTMYNILKDHSVKLKRTGGMSGSQERRWKRFIAQVWEQPCRSMELAEPIVREIRAKAGVFDGNTGEVQVPTDEEVAKNIYESEVEPSKEKSSGKISPREAPTTKAEKRVIVRNFGAQPVKLEVKIDSIDDEIAQEIINFIIEKKAENPVGVGRISFTLPPIG